MIPLEVREYSAESLYNGRGRGRIKKRAVPVGYNNNIFFFLFLQYS